MDGAQKIKVLIIDDEPLIIDTVEVFLKDFELEIIKSLDPQKSLSLVFEQSIELIISDINMTKLNGLEMLQVLRAQGYHHPCIFLSAMPSHKILQQAIRLEAFDFLTKPVEQNDLCLSVSRAIEKIKTKKWKYLMTYKFSQDPLRTSVQLHFVQSASLHPAHATTFSRYTTHSV